MLRKDNPSYSTKYQSVRVPRRGEDGFAVPYPIHELMSAKTTVPRLLVTWRLLTLGYIRSLGSLSWSATSEDGWLTHLETCP